jgi:opacity protein-like surface antigen
MAEMVLRQMKLILFLITLLLAGGSAAYGSDLTVYVGGMVPGRITLNNARTALEGSPVVGLRFANNFARVIGFEHTLAYSPDFLKPEDSATIQNVKGIIYNSNLVLNIPVNGVTPYFTFGLGVIAPFGSDASLLFGTKFAVNYGGGLKFNNLLGPLGLRFDARGYTATNVLSRNLRIFELSGGLFFSFGW